MALPRLPAVWVRRLFAAVVAAGTASPAVGQAPDIGVSVDAPRAQVLVPSSPFSVLPDAAQAAAFRTPSVTETTADQPPTTTFGSGPPAGSPGWVSPADGSAMPGSPLGPNTWQPVMTTGPQYPPMVATPVAPAWRWHGYGAVAPLDVPPARPSSEPTNGGRQPITASQAPNQGADAPHSLTNPDVKTGTESKPPVAAPSAPAPVVTPPADPIPPPLPPIVQPISSVEPGWRPAVQQVGYMQANPMTAGAAPWSAVIPAAVVVTTTAANDEWQGRAVMLDAPRPAGTYISRGVSSDAAIQPASYIAPPVPAKAQPIRVLPAVRTGIERVCAGRVRDVEIVTRGTASLLVRLKVRQASDAEFVANSIARLPELEPYQVLFEMQVVR